MVPAPTGNALVDVAGSVVPSIQEPYGILHVFVSWLVVHASLEMTGRLAYKTSTHYA